VCGVAAPVAHVVLAGEFEVIDASEAALEPTQTPDDAAIRPGDLVKSVGVAAGENIVALWCFVHRICVNVVVGTRLLPKEVGTPECALIQRDMACALLPIARTPFPYSLPRLHILLCESVAGNRTPLRQPGALELLSRVVVSVLGGYNHRSRAIVDNVQLVRVEVFVGRRGILMLSHLVGLVDEHGIPTAVHGSENVLYPLAVSKVHSTDGETLDPPNVPGVLQFRRAPDEGAMLIIIMWALPSSVRRIALPAVFVGREKPVPWRQCGLVVDVDVPSCQNRRVEGSAIVSALSRNIKGLRAQHRVRSCLGEPFHPSGLTRGLDVWARDEGPEVVGGVGLCHLASQNRERAEGSRAGGCANSHLATIYYRSTTRKKCCKDILQNNSRTFSRGEEICW